MFSGVVIVEEVDGVGDVSGDNHSSSCTVTLEGLLNMFLRYVSLMKLFTGNKQNFLSWECSPQMLVYQDF